MENSTALIRVADRLRIALQHAVVFGAQKAQGHTLVGRRGDLRLLCVFFLMGIYDEHCYCIFIMIVEVFLI